MKFLRGWGGTQLKSLCTKSACKPVFPTIRHLIPGSSFCERVVHSNSGPNPRPCMIQLFSSFLSRRMCVAGVVSIHPLKKIKIGTPQRSRWLGNAPRSGLWNRKTGHFGRKIRALPPVEEVKEPEPPKVWPAYLAAFTGFQNAT